MDSTTSPTSEKIHSSQGRYRVLYTYGNPEYNPAQKQSLNGNFSNRHNQALVATGSSAVSAYHSYSGVKDSQRFLSTFGEDSQSLADMDSNVPGTGSSHALLQSLQNDSIEVQIGPKKPDLPSLGAPSHPELLRGGAAGTNKKVSNQPLKVYGMFDESVALRGRLAPPDSVPFRARLPISIRAKYLTNSGVKTTVSEKDDISSPTSLEDVPWTDRNWQEQQASKYNPNAEDLILGHPTYVLEFKNYLHSHDKFSLEKVQELERIAAVTHTPFGWFHHDAYGVKCLHRQWILILARNLEVLRYAPLEVRNAYWLQKAEAFDKVYSYWMQNLGLNPDKGLTGQEVPVPAHPPLDDNGMPLIEIPYSDTEGSNKENLGGTKPRRAMRRASKAKLSTKKVPKTLAGKVTLPRTQRAKYTGMLAPQPSAELQKSKKRPLDESVDGPMDTNSSPKRPGGRPQKFAPSVQAPTE